MAEAFICLPSPAPRAGDDIHPGLGEVALCANGVQIAGDQRGKHKLSYYTRRAREIKATDANTAITLHIDGPLYNAIYAFGSEGWVLINRDLGFA
jgi:hypothetical protein